MKSSASTIIAVTVVSLALYGSVASASPIVVQTYSSQTSLLAALGIPESEELNYLVAWNEFGSGGLGLPSPIAVVVEGIGNQSFNSGSWDTTGPFSFRMVSGSANGFFLEYAPLSGNVPPQVTMILTNGGSFPVGPLAGGQVPGGNFLFFAFTSSEAFSAVSIDAGSGVAFSADIAGFLNQPTAVPEPATLLLLGTGLLVIRRRSARK